MVVTTIEPAVSRMRARTADTQRTIAPKRTPAAGTRRAGPKAPRIQNDTPKNKAPAQRNIAAIKKQRNLLTLLSRYTRTPPAAISWTISLCIIASGLRTHLVSRFLTIGAASRLGVAPAVRYHPSYAPGRDSALVQLRGNAGRHAWPGPHGFRRDLCGGLRKQRPHDRDRA